MTKAASITAFVLNLIACARNMKQYVSDSSLLMSEWDFEANKDLNPSQLTYGSNKRAWWKCAKCGGRWQASICDRTRTNSTGCPFCASQKVLKGYNDLATKFPEIAKDWHPTKNGSLLPSDIMGGSSKKVWWICSKGHAYKQPVAQRTSRNGSCPYCSGQRVLVGFNDLESLYPEIAKDWHPTKNGNLTPANITSGSNKKYWWQCQKCGYEWHVRAADRTRDKTGCPVCANKVALPGFNDLESQFPEIAREWNYAKNGHLTPKDVVAKSAKKVWWVCAKGHEYRQIVNQKTVRGAGCPFCTGRSVLTGYNDLATKFPEIASEWHPTKNRTIVPQLVSSGTKKIVWWLCSLGHEYKQAIDKRTAREQSCPYCSGHKAWKGFNDFETKFPEIAKEWHPTKNGSLKPSDVTFGSGKRVWWKCPIGHEYQAVINDRGNGQTNCPICNARNLTSFGEQAVFYYMKQVFSDALNRYKELFDTSMEFDVYIPSLNLAIEYDGYYWHQSDDVYEREQKKYRFCKENGITLCRVKEKTSQFRDNIADQIYYLDKVKRKDFSELEQAIRQILADIDSNIVIDINIERDKNEIQSYLCEIENSLAKVRPDVAAKWNFEKNGQLKPEMFSVNSNEVVWWHCPDCGHEWKCAVNGMTREGRYGCAVCAQIYRGKTFTKGVVQRVGSLAEKMPELAKQWHPTKNGELTPHDITAGRFKPVWWLCDKCGHEWQASPNLRKRGIGCPCCCGRVPKIGVNDVETRFPEITKIWDYEKNAPLNPCEFLPNSGKRVWWKCSECGHSWQTEILKMGKKFVCPCCKGQGDLFSCYTNKTIK